MIFDLKKTQVRFFIADFSFDFAKNMAKNRGKMTPIQVQMLVDILCENPELASGQVTSSSLSREERNKKWEAIATLLNSKGLGPEKTPDQWRKVW